jgi:hypothetical protein
MTTLLVNSDHPGRQVDVIEGQTERLSLAQPGSGA